MQSESNPAILPEGIVFDEAPEASLYSHPIEVVNRDPETEIYKPCVGKEYKAVSESLSSFSNSIGERHTVTAQKDFETAKAVIDLAIKRHPKALGVVLLVHNESSDRGLEILTGIEQGTLQLYNVFAHLGIAPVYLQNPDKYLLKATVELLSGSTTEQSENIAVELPESYQYLFVYITGHGADRRFYTHDGDVSYKFVVDSFQKSRKSFRQRYFFFDCCLSTMCFPDSKPEPCRGSRLVYATVSGKKSWGKHGVSFMTRSIVNLLQKCSSMDEVIRKLKKHVTEEFKSQEPSAQVAATIEDQRPTSPEPPTQVDATIEDLRLAELRNQNMQGKLELIKFSDDKATAEFSVCIKPPLCYCINDPTNGSGTTACCDIVLLNEGGGNTRLHPLQSLPTNEIGFSPGSETPVIITLTRKLPPNRPTGKITVQAFVHYSGYTVPSNGVKVTFPKPHVPTSVEASFPRGHDVPMVTVKWAYDMQSAYEELTVKKFTVKVEDKNAGVCEEKIIAPVNPLLHSCNVEFPTLHQYSDNDLSVCVIATRTDNDQFTSKRITSARTKCTIKSTSLTLTPMGTLQPKLRISWSLSLSDPTVTAYIARVLRPSQSSIDVCVQANHPQTVFEVDKPVKNLFRCSSVKVQLIAKRGDGSEQQLDEKHIDIPKGRIQKLIAWSSFCRAVVSLFLILSFVLLVLAIINLLKNSTLAENDVKIAFTGSDCVEIAYGSNVPTGLRFLLCFDGWNVQNCDNSPNNDNKTAFCDTYESGVLSKQRYSNTYEAFALQHTCIDNGPHVISLHSVSKSASDALKIYLLRNSNITIELCAPYKGSKTYSFDLVLLNNWAALNEFLNDMDIDGKSIVSTLHMHYGEHQPCRNYTIPPVEKSSYVYFAVKVHSSHVEFKLLRGIVNKLYYKTKDLHILASKNAVKDADENQWSSFQADVTDTLVCVAPGADSFKLCLTASFTCNCFPFIAVAVLSAVLFFLSLCICLCKCRKHVNSRNGYTALPQTAVDDSSWTDVVSQTMAI